MLEATLRDLLAAQLEVLEPGLRLLDVERHIPNTLGTSSFIDLLARDEKNHWVLIELKRSDSAARQAIHEVLKYVEGVKAHLGVRDDEVRVIITSTEWRELRVPFSKFVADTNTSVKGIKLCVDDATGVINACKMQPLPVIQGRVIAPWHELNFYTGKASLERGIKTYDVCCATKGLNDYVLIVLRAPEGLHERSVEATRASLTQLYTQHGGSVDEGHVNDMLGKLQKREYALYFAPMLLTMERCFEVLRKDEAAHQEALELADAMSEEEALCNLREAIYSMEPRPHYDDYEIGYAAKFKSRLIDGEGWSIEAIVKKGVFERNALLSDSALLEEISGATGTSGQRFKRTLSAANKAHLEAAKAEIGDCLSNNPVWRSNIINHLEDIKREHPFAEVDVSIFNPSTGVFTLFNAASREDGILYVPNYSLLVRDKNPLRVYFGELVVDGVVGTLRDVLDNFYHGDLGALLITASWSSYEPRDTDVLETLSLVYGSYRCDIDEKENKFFPQWALEGNKGDCPFQSVC